MGESSGSISIDVERISYCGEDHHIRTKHGSVAVTVFGDKEKPGIITYPDIALNSTSCFQRLLLFCPQASSLLLHNFCFYHICPPGHELGANPISSDIPVPSVDDLADQVADVLDFFGLDCVMCLGVTAGAYILSLFAIKHKSRVAGLILVSPLCKSPSWTEWMFNNVMSNLLYYYGMSSTVKDRWVQRYFSKELCSDSNNLQSEIVQACRRLLDERQSTNILRFLQSINWRHDITERLQKLQCQTIIFVGDDSPFHSDALDIALKLGKNYCALVEVQACGSVVTEEHPESMAVPLEYFLLGYGLNKPREPNSNHDTTPGPPCISADLLSPESMGIKLKPIKTRVSLKAWG